MSPARKSSRTKGSNLDGDPELEVTSSINRMSLSQKAASERGDFASTASNLPRGYGVDRQQSGGGRTPGIRSLDKLDSKSTHSSRRANSTRSQKTDENKYSHRHRKKRIHSHRRHRLETEQSLSRDNNDKQLTSELDPLVAGEGGKPEASSSHVPPDHQADQWWWQDEHEFDNDGPRDGNGGTNRQSFKVERPPSTSPSRRRSNKAADGQNSKKPEPGRTQNTKGQNTKQPCSLQQSHAWSRFLMRSIVELETWDGHSDLGSKQRVLRDGNNNIILVRKRKHSSKKQRAEKDDLLKEAESWYNGLNESGQKSIWEKFKIWQQRNRKNAESKTGTDTLVISKKRQQGNSGRTTLYGKNTKQANEPTEHSRGHLNSSSTIRRDQEASITPWPAAEDFRLVYERQRADREFLGGPTVQELQLVNDKLEAERYGNAFDQGHGSKKGPMKDSADSYRSNYQPELGESFLYGNFSNENDLHSVESSDEIWEKTRHLTTHSSFKNIRAMTPNANGKCKWCGRNEKLHGSSICEPCTIIGFPPGGPTASHTSEKSISTPFQHGPAENTTKLNTHYPNTSSVYSVDSGGSPSPKSGRQPSRALASGEATLPRKTVISSQSSSRNTNRSKRTNMAHSKTKSSASVATQWPIWRGSSLPATTGGHPTADREESPAAKLRYEQQIREKQRDSDRDRYAVLEVLQPPSAPIDSRSVATEHNNGLKRRESEWQRWSNDEGWDAEIGFKLFR